MITSPAVNAITEPWKVGPPQGATPAPGAGKPVTNPVGAVQKSGAVGAPATTQPTPAPQQAPTTPPVPATTQPQPAPTTPDSLSWSTFQNGLQQARQDPNFTPPPMDEATWNAMNPADRYQFILANGLGGQFGPGGWLLADQNQSAAYTAKFGAPTGQLVYGYGDPTQFGKGMDAWAVDPTKILRNPDGSWVMDSSNVDQSKWGVLRQTDDQSGLNLNPAMGVAFVLGAGLLGDFAFGLNGAEAGTGAFDVGGSTGFGGSTPLNVPAAADTLTPGINNAIDTSLLPNVTAPPIADVAPTPDILPPVAGGGGGGPGGFDASTPSPAPGGGDTTIDGVNYGPGSTIEGPTDTYSTNPPGFVDRVTNALTADPLRTIGTGLTVGSLLGRKSPGVPQNLQNTVNNNGPLGDQARGVLTNNGAPSPDQMSVINDTIEQQRRMGTEAIMQSSINSGMGGKDSMVTQDKIRAFGEQLAVMKEQMVQKQAEQNVLLAMQELGMVTQEQFQLAEIELQQNTAAQQRAASIMSSLGWLWSGAAGKTTTTTTSGP